MKKLKEILKKIAFSKITATFAAWVILATPGLLSLQPLWHEEPKLPECMKQA